ncbi:MAG: hypothetical protein AAFR57_05050 [Pseudomonadota bacterium]
MERFFTVTVRHAYWGEEVPPLTLVPGRKFAGQIAALGGVIRPRPGGLICGVPEGAGDLDETLTQPMEIDMVATDPMVEMVTDEAMGPGTVPIFTVTCVSDETDTTRLSLETAQAVTGGFSAFARLLVTAEPEGRDLSASVEFAAVARIWTYNVTGGDASAKLAVQDPAGAASFDRIADRRLPNGTTARCFRSHDAIHLNRRPPERFELVSEGPFGPRTIVPILPTPTPTALRKDPDSGQLTSDIYVNL